MRTGVRFALPAEHLTAAQSISSPDGGRMQLALNVSDIDGAVDFHSKLFRTGPAGRRPGYASFAITSPPLKLVLIESADARESGVTDALNHLGVDVADPADVAAASRRLTGEGLDTLTQDATTCCYAVQDKVWVHDPDGAPWEVYTVLAYSPASTSLRGDGQRCATDTTDTAWRGSGRGADRRLWGPGRGEQYLLVRVGPAPLGRRALAEALGTALLVASSSVPASPPSGRPGPTSACSSPRTRWLPPPTCSRSSSRSGRFPERTAPGRQPRRRPARGP